MELILHTSSEGMNWALEPTHDPGEFLFTWIQATLWAPVSMGIYLLHCSPLWLCKNIFKGKDIVTEWGSLKLFLEQEEVCASGRPLGNGCLHTASFHPNILATRVVSAGNGLQRTTITSLCFMLFTVNSTGMLQAPTVCQAFFQNGTRPPSMPEQSSRRDSQLLQVPGAATVETPWRLRARSHCKKASPKSRRETGKRAWL